MKNPCGVANPVRAETRARAADRSMICLLITAQIRQARPAIGPRTTISPPISSLNRSGLPSSPMIRKLSMSAEVRAVKVRTPPIIAGPDPPTPAPSEEYQTLRVDVGWWCWWRVRFVRGLTVKGVF
ncbi:hypothetical protein ABH935_010236 [Catenulispora sp. GAS73]|uniref:hypothetical protein n=1 Tax=Catenulispora sp. GAS73 TaxID=3156269 RepID=UPI00351992C7